MVCFTDKLEENLCPPEEALKEIRWFVRCGDFDKAGNLADNYEKRYNKLMEMPDMDDFQCSFRVLKLEIMTQGFTKMEISQKEEETIAGLYNILTRMNKLPVRGMRYLFQREEFLRLQKRLDFLDAQKTLKYVIGGAMLSLPLLTMIMSWIFMKIGIISGFTTNFVVFSATVMWLLIILFEIVICKKEYDKWQIFLMHPVPFEHSELF